jgi:class 3 adenylate cyclase
MTSSRRSRTPLLIVFLDLDGYKLACEQRGDLEVADMIDDYYDRVATAARAAGGRVVKFIGDAALIVFPERAIDAGVGMLLDLVPKIDAFMREREWACRLRAKAHFGDVIAGEFGSTGAARFDVMGREVNEATLMTTTGIAVSSAALAKLSAKTRKRVEVHTS